MRKLRVLLVENSGFQAGSIQRGALDIGTFECVLQGDAESAISAARASSFDVAFLDLNLTEHGKLTYDGINLAQRLRKEFPSLVIIIYSSSIEEADELTFRHRNDCLEAGADEVMSDSRLLAHTPQKLEKTLRELISRKANADQRQPITLATDLATRAACEEFGETELMGLLHRAAEGLSDVQVLTLQPGFSGAAIFRLNAVMTVGRSPVKWVLKVSRSRDALADELQRRPVPGTHLARYAAVPEGQIVSHAGLYLVYMPFINGMTLLREFLFLATDLTTTDEVTLGKLVTDLLVQPALHSYAYSTDVSQSDDYCLKLTAALGIQEVVREAANWESILTREQLDAIKATGEFVIRLTNGLWSFTRQGRHAAVLHGDFHCRNIFILAGQAPCIIDFGRKDIFPRLFDFAALDVDLILSVDDHVSGRDHDFKRIEKWYAEVTKDFPYVDKPRTSATKSRPAWLRRRLLRTMVENISGVTVQEYSEVVLFHLFRYLRFPNVTPARKVLACRLVERLLEKMGLKSAKNKIG